MMRRLRSCALGALALLATVPFLAADWPQWRGPNRDGLVAGFKIPRTWPAQLKQVWQVEVGLGHSSPLVLGEQVYMFSRRGEEETLAALNLGDGKELWRQSYAAPYEVNSVAAAHGKGPKSTPAAADGRIFTFGISGVLTCWDAKTGAKSWQLEFSKQFPATSPLYGAATSPLVDGDKCIVFVGGQDRGALCAFDVKSGKQLWAWTGDGPGYTSPVVATFSGVRQLVTQSQGACLGLDPDTGKLLWRISYKTEYDQNSVTPLIYAESVIFAGYGKGIERYRIEKQGDEWRTDEMWSNKEVSLYMSSPVLSGDRMYGFSHRQKGQLFALDLTTGKTLWTGDGRLAESASLVRSGSVLFALTTQAELIAFRDTEKQFEEFAHYKVSATPTWAHPVALTGGVLVKDESTLTLWQIE